MAGHDVKVANSRGPETIDADILGHGARAVTAEEAIADREVIILSIPFNRVPDLKPLLAAIPVETVVIDTSNYYPARDGKIDAIEAGQVESVWVSEQLDRPVAKAWNAIGSASFAEKGSAPDASDRIAIPIAADRETDRKVTMTLVEDSGLDAVDAGSISDSWRQQPGAPVYCTDLTKAEIAPALAAAEKDRLPKRRDLAVAVITERMGDGTTNPDADYLPRLNRAIYM